MNCPECGSPFVDIIYLPHKTVRPSGFTSPGDRRVKCECQTCDHMWTGEAWPPDMVELRSGRIVRLEEIARLAAVDYYRPYRSRAYFAVVVKKPSSRRRRLEIAEEDYLHLRALLETG